MAAESNMAGYQYHHHHHHQGMMDQQQMLSFQSGAMGMANSVNMRVVGGQATAGPSSSSMGQLDDASGELSPEWTIEEEFALKQGLIKYAGEQSMMKYIKIAATLPRKTVRDVALRCRWLAENGKRRKLEEQYAGKRIYNRKEKMVDCLANSDRYTANPGAAASYSSMIHQVNKKDLFLSKVPDLDGTTQKLMDENSQMLHRISTNLATYKVQENIDLFCHMRNNIRTVLDLTCIQRNMSNMPGMMTEMPPIPMPNEGLLHAILSGPNQASIFSGPGFHVEQQTTQ